MDLGKSVSSSGAARSSQGQCISGIEGRLLLLTFCQFIPNLNWKQLNLGVTDTEHMG